MMHGQRNIKLYK